MKRVMGFFGCILVAAPFVVIGAVVATDEGLAATATAFGAATLIASSVLGGVALVGWAWGKG